MNLTRVEGVIGEQLVCMRKGAMTKTRKERGGLEVTDDSEYKPLSSLSLWESWPLLERKSEWRQMIWSSL